jgi:putative ABC transport system permease protein
VVARHRAVPDTGRDRPATYGYAVLLTLVAATVSAALVRRRIDRLDLIRVVKTRE